MTDLVLIIVEGREGNNALGHFTVFRGNRLHRVADRQFVLGVVFLRVLSDRRAAFRHDGIGELTRFEYAALQVLFGGQIEVAVRPVGVGEAGGIVALHKRAAQRAAAVIGNGDFHGLAGVVILHAIQEEGRGAAFGSGLAVRVLRGGGRLFSHGVFKGLALDAACVALHVSQVAQGEPEITVADRRFIGGGIQCADRHVAGSNAVAALGAADRRAIHSRHCEGEAVVRAELPVFHHLLSAEGGGAVRVIVIDEFRRGKECGEVYIFRIGFYDRQRAVVIVRNDHARIDLLRRVFGGHAGVGRIGRIDDVFRNLVQVDISGVALRRVLEVVEVGESDAAVRGVGHRQFRRSVIRTVRLFGGGAARRDRRDGEAELARRDRLAVQHLANGKVIMAFGPVIIHEHDVAGLGTIGGDAFPLIILLSARCSELVAGSHFGIGHHRNAFRVRFFAEREVCPAGEEFSEGQALAGLQAQLKFRGRMRRIAIGTFDAVVIIDRLAPLLGAQRRLIGGLYQYHLARRIIQLILFVPKVQIKQEGLDRGVGAGYILL